MLTYANRFCFPALALPMPVTYSSVPRRMSSDDREDFLLLRATHQSLMSSSDSPPVFALTRRTGADEWAAVSLSALFGSDEARGDVVFALRDLAAQSASLTPSWQLRNLLALLTLSRDMSGESGARYKVGSKIRVLAVRGVMISLDVAASDGDWKLNLGVLMS
jgi:hypothetical protein